MSQKPSFITRFNQQFINTSPVRIDLVILLTFTILITLQPYYLHGQINLFELGIYLPGIKTVLDGGIPYRDVFHLRGPLELYVPAFFMQIFGQNMAVLATFFYIGTMFTMLLGVVIAKNLFKTRFVLYLFVPVFIAKTFPRVVFMYWGGMRYVLGLLSVLLVIYYFKKNKSQALFFSGVAAALAGLTSAEVGVCAILGIGATFALSFLFKIQERQNLFKSVGQYAAGVLVIAVPYVVYLLLTSSLTHYIDHTFHVATQMTKAFPSYLVSDRPKHYGDMIYGMAPWSMYFKHLTPMYCYVFFAGYITWRYKKNKVSTADLGLINLAFYGFIMYNLAFRNIEGAQFEMALQPEKILLLLMCEEFFLWLRNKGRELVPISPKSISVRFKIGVIGFLILGFVGSSWGLAISKFNRRFFAYWWLRDTISGKGTDHLANKFMQEKQPMKLTIPTAHGMTVPVEQGENFRQTLRFVNANIKEDEKTFFFPELGSYYFIVDRPMVGRFPMPTFAWIKQEWHEELMNDLKADKPNFIFIDKDPGEIFPMAHFKVEQNKINYDEIINFVEKNYSKVGETNDLWIYKRL